MCTGIEIMVGASIVSGVAGIAQGFVSSSAAASRAAAQQAQANAAAQMQQISANQEAVMLRNNAAMTAIEADALREKKNQERDSQNRNNEIKMAAEKANASSGGLTVAGTSLERLLVQNDQTRKDNLALTLWNYDMQIQTKDYEEYLYNYRADVTEDLGASQADVTRYGGNLQYNAGMAESTSYMTGGIATGIGNAASIASKANWGSTGGITSQSEWGIGSINLREAGL